MDTNLLIVAAGRSSRMGFPKALSTIYDEPLIIHQVRRARAAGVNQVGIVLGYHEARLRQVLSKHFHELTFIRNPDPNGDMFSSVKLGLKQMELESTFFLPVDVPVKTEEPFDILSQEAGVNDVRIPVFDKKRGHPPLFQPHFIKTILESNPPEGIRSLYRNSETTIEEVPVNDPSVTWDLDRPEDLHKFRQQSVEDER